MGKMGVSMLSCLYMTQGGGSANKTFLYQQTKALLNPKSLALVSSRDTLKYTYFIPLYPS